ncbi:hypothetical protein [Viridibacillus soli]|nr:hypothetical protein [Viridibacillus soli]
MTKKMRKAVRICYHVLEVAGSISSIYRTIHSINVTSGKSYI